MSEGLKIVVLMGGFSAEREVSLRSGRAVAEALRSRNHRVIEYDLRDENWQLPEGIDVVFLALHGTYGEDGTVQAVLEKMGIPYTGSGPEASRLAFNKVLTKKRCIECGVLTPRYVVVTDPQARLPDSLELPVVVKPVRQGSSVGVKFVEQHNQWYEALAEAFKYDTEVLVEERVFGREVTVGILEGRPLPVIEIKPRSGRYDYASKYTLGATEYVCPAAFDSETTARIQGVALTVFNAIGCRDYARVDMIVRDDGKPYFLEINTLPGMTATSLFPKAAAAAGISYPELCERMVRLALKRAKTS